MSDFEQNENDLIKNMHPEDLEVLQYLTNNPTKYTLVGSRALGIHSKSSDFDFVCHIDNFTGWLEARGFCLDIRNYVNVLPMGNGILVKFRDAIDLLVYENLNDVLALQDSINTMQKWKDTFAEAYKDKAFRVTMFEALYKYNQKIEREL